MRTCFNLCLVHLSSYSSKFVDFMTEKWRNWNEQKDMEYNQRRSQWTIRSSPPLIQYMYFWKYVAFLQWKISAHDIQRCHIISTEVCDGYTWANIFHCVCSQKWCDYMYVCSTYVYMYCTYYTKHVIPTACESEAGAFYESFPGVFSGSSYADLYGRYSYRLGDMKNHEFLQNSPFYVKMGIYM